MLANGDADKAKCDHKYNTVGDGVQQCSNCLKKQYYDYPTKSWHDTK